MLGEMSIDNRRMIQAGIDALFANAISMETFVRQHELVSALYRTLRANAASQPCVRERDVGLASSTN